MAWFHPASAQIAAAVLLFARKTHLTLNYYTALKTQELQIPLHLKKGEQHEDNIVTRHC